MKISRLTLLGTAHAISLVLGLTLSGCSSGSSSSAAAPANNTSTLPISALGGEPLSECNGTTLSASGMSIELEDYYSNGVYNSGQIRAKITAVPAEFSNTSQAYFDFYRWEASSANVASIDPTPMTFDLIDPNNNNKILGTFNSNKLDQSAFAAIQSAKGITGDLTSLELVIHGTSSNYQVIRVAVKKSAGSATDTVIDQGDILIPAFTANPNTYATSHVALLNGIHPLNSVSGNGNSSTQYQQYIHGLYCFRTVGQ
jgi:hypothetical protein